MKGQHLKSTQYCGVPGNSILDAVATERDAIAHAEYANTPLCILKFDFKNAFVRVAHSYLFIILHSYVLSPPSSISSGICTIALFQLCR